MGLAAVTASLSPNSAVPLFRNKPACDTAGATGHAAGVMFVAPDGDVLLLRRSPAEKNFGGHWALPGGGVEEGETAWDGAMREVSEEIGGPGDDAIFGAAFTGKKARLLDQRRTPTGMVFHTFAVPTEEKFVPRLNDEHVGYTWSSLKDLPGPMHPAVEATIRERVGVGSDMAPEDWEGLRDGFAKWTLEEEAESEHAEDAKLSHESVRYGASTGEDKCRRCAHYQKDGPHCELVEDPIDPDGWCERFLVDQLVTDSALIALDKDSVRSFDGDGRMRVATTNLSKATVNPYRGKEIPGWQDLGLDPDRVYQLLRDPDELRKAADTFNGVQLLRKHIPVNAEDHQPWDVVGTTGTEAKYEHPYLKNSLHVWHKDAIDDIESDAKRELSCGYHYRPDMTPGVFGGMRYDGVMRDIRGNHVALVKDGRAGPDVLVGDSMESLMAKPTRFAALTLGLVAAQVAPLMALDQQVALPKSLFDGVTSKNFKSKRAELLAGVRAGLDGKVRKGIALDASMEHIGKVMDNVAGLFGGGSQSVDESVSEEQHKAMEAAAHGESDLGIPKSVGEEYVSKDAAALGEFLKSKGMGADDIKTACDMFPKPAADSEEEESEEDNDGEKKPPAVDAENEELKKKLEAKDAEMKDMVKKPAMDEAIKSAVAAERKNQQEVRQAIAFVRPWVGELKADLAMDTAEQVYRNAAETLGIADAKTVHGSALRSLISMAPKPGEHHKRAPGARLALDEDTRSAAAKIAPGIENIQVGV